MNYGLGGIDYHERDAMPIRSPAYAQLLIDSADRAPGQSPNDFTIYRNQSLLYGYFYRLAISQLQFNWDNPTIMTGVNDTFQIAVTGSNNQAFTIPEGYYTPTTLAAAIQTIIQAAGGPYAPFTAAYVDANGGIVVSSNSTDTFVFVDNGSSLYRNTARSIGLTPPNFGPPLAVQPLGVPGLLYTHYVDIISRNLTKYQRVKDSDASARNVKSYIVARIYLSPSNNLVETTSTSGIGSKPFTLTVDYATPKFIKYSPDEALSEIDLQVLDEYGEPLHWDGVQSNWSFAFTLLASES